ncbi:MAG: CYTH domain-containing protein [Gammaproteobacteria bacterium]|nr:CYTH domain-containing protein [Gammaproteobacteria bacterium]MCP5407047.1 CYTH domain-containing protein [Chromatiaceae bacterium]MCP5445107.1 CYTH domain-containing protein [Chromatiaceae bacterium]
MALEIEHKFLVKNDLWRSNVISETRLQQGYLANQKNASVRIRTGNGKAHLNIKSTTLGIRRLEFEYEIPLADAREMLREIAIQPFIDKTRYIVRNGAHDWELDVFEGENHGLIVAELELESEDEPFELPEWAGEEVSGDVKYYNVNLIKHPFSQW